MATSTDIEDEIRVPLENRWQRALVAAGFIAALAVAAVVAAQMMPPDRRLLIQACAVALGGCFLYVALSAPRLRTFPDFAVTFGPRSMRFPAYPLWRHRHHEIVYADVNDLHERTDGVPWLGLTTTQGAFRIPLELLPAEWTPPRIAALIKARKQSPQA